VLRRFTRIGHVPPQAAPAPTPITPAPPVLAAGALPPEEGCAQLR